MKAKHTTTDELSEMPPVRWGILGAANIATATVIPAMQQSPHTPVVAIASRTKAKADAAAQALGIARSYGSYEELLDDPDIDAIYNPLPNHLHVPWSIKAAEAGKHVLCEKPIAMSAAETRELIAVRDRTGVQIAEAFMVRTHPQWAAVRELIAEGRIGDLRMINGHFSYFRKDPNDVRSKPEWGGGVLMDVACYPITISRWVFGEEPTSVAGMLEMDPDFHVDRLGGGLMKFPSGMATFSFGGQLVGYQKVNIFGTEGRIEVEIPFNAPPDRACRIFVDNGKALGGLAAEPITFPAVNQYRLQGERFSEAVRGLGRVPCSLEDALGNMAVIDAVFRAAKSEKWETPSS